ncbi:MAG TPA: Rv3235 family protein [Actinophytocola sp.]|nr:Rv3235 family protein [Actinophytocola sp.]
MSVPALEEPSPGGVVLYSLPDYEPGSPPRWSSLRPARGPQLTLVGPPAEPVVPAPEVLGRLVRHVLEVLDGRRVVDQLRTILSDPAYEALLTRLRTTAPGHRHRLLRLHTCYPTPNAVELSAVIEVSGRPKERSRVRAAAIRFERVNDRWHCAVLRIL